MDVPPVTTANTCPSFPPTTVAFTPVKATFNESVGSVIRTPFVIVQPFLSFVITVKLSAFNVN